MIILLADDHALIRDGIKLVLQRLDNDVEVLEANNYDEAYNISNEADQIDLILLDLNMPDMDKYEGISNIRAIAPNSHLVILSASNDSNDIRQSLKRGANGYIPKSSPNEVLLSAIQLVLSGGTYIPPAALHEDYHYTSKTPTETNEVKIDPENRAAQLTKRQLEVIDLLVEGDSNKLIAETLHISDTTVKAHLNAIFKLLNVKNRTQAVRKIMELGIQPKAYRGGTQK